MILGLYLLLLLFGFLLARTLKKKYSGPTLTAPIALVCIVFNLFLGMIYIDVVQTSNLMFYGDLSTLIDEYPEIKLIALACALVHGACIPMRRQ